MTRGQSLQTLPQLSPLLLSMFQRYSARHLAMHLHAIRLSRARRPDLTAIRQRPLIVYLNHPSWWDPLVCLQLATQHMPGRRHFAPIEADALERHAFFRRIGFFAVDLRNARDAHRFLDTACQILEQPEATLWIAATRGLSDPRERPVELEPSLGHLANRLRHGVLLPLAIEYPFWAEQRPEAVLRFGEEVAVEDVGMRAHDWTAVLAAQLESAQDALAAEARSRDATLFELLLGGAVPAADREPRGPREAWRRLRELLRGRRLRSQPGDQDAPG
jgi:1-acyl-sn-glycerol-3-phosphate acyltransferase